MPIHMDEKVYSCSACIITNLADTGHIGIASTAGPSERHPFFSEGCGTVRALSRVRAQIAGAVMPVRYQFATVDWCGFVFCSGNAGRAKVSNSPARIPADPSAWSGVAGGMARGVSKFPHVLAFPLCSRDASTCGVGGRRREATFSDVSSRRNRRGRWDSGHHPHRPLLEAKRLGSRAFTRRNDRPRTF